MTWLPDYPTVWVTVTGASTVAAIAWRLGYWQGRKEELHFWLKFATMESAPSARDEARSDAQITRNLVMLIPGGQEIIERALRHCAEQNDGQVVGNPSVPELLSEREYGGQAVSALIVDTSADPTGWWAQYQQLHGWREMRGEPAGPRKPVAQLQI